MNVAKRTAAYASTILTFLLVAAPVCAETNPADDFMALADFSRRYAAAWSSQDPDQLASMYSADGALVVNEGEPAVGRKAIAAKAAGFMEAFPDMKVEMIAVQKDGDGARFDWRWTGTNSGPGGTGRHVNIRGFELWTFGEDGLIQQSLGNYDKTDFDRQVNPEQ